MSDATAGRPASADDVRVSWSLFRDERDRVPEPIAGTFGEVAPGLFDRVAIRAGKSGRAWSPTTYADGATRGNGGVVAISAVVLDFDHGGTPERARQRVVELGLAAWIHSTHSSTPENPRFRLIVPLVDHVPAAEWPGVWPRARAHLDPDGLSDSATGDPSRIYFLPSARPEYPSFTYRVSGRALRLDELPPAAADPRRPGDTAPAIASRDLPPAVGTAELLARVGGFSAEGPLFRRLLETTRGEARAHSTNLVLAWVLYRCGATEGQIADFTEWPASEVRSTVRHFETDGAYSFALETLREADPVFAKVEREALAAAASAREAGTGVDGPASSLWDAADEPVRAEFVKHLMQWHAFAAFDDSRELLVYQDGVYARTAAAFVDGWVEARFNARQRTASAKFRSEVELAIRARSYVPRDSFNPHGQLNVANGVLNLTDGSFRPHSPDLRFTYKLSADFDPNASCPRFNSFLAEVLPDERARRLALEFAGYTLDETNPYQAALVLVGDGENGKSTFLGAIVSVLGHENVAAETLQRLSRGAFSAAELYGKRANVCGDIPSDRLTATGAFKLLTGGDPISAERKHRDPFQFVWGGKPLFGCNGLPEVDDDSHAFFRRWFILPFNVRIDPARRDPNLPAALAAERSGILNLMLEARKALHERGGFDAATVAADREEWAKRSNSLRWFLSERVIAEPSAWTPKSEFMAAYGAWCGEKGVTPKTASEVGAQLGRWIPGAASSGRRQAGRVIRVWSGVRLAPTEPPGESEKESSEEPEKELGAAAPSGGVTGVTGVTGGPYTHTHARARPHARILDTYPPVTPVTGVTGDPGPDPEDIFNGKPSRADRARASGRWADPPSDGDGSPPTEPSSIDPPSVAPPLLGAVPPDPSRLEAATTDPAATQTADPPRPDSARLEAATRELTDLLRSVGTADRNVIHSILGASGYSGSEISAAVGSVCGAGLVRQDPGGVLRWKEADP